MKIGCLGVGNIKDRDIVIHIVFHKAFINNDTIVSQNLTKKRTKGGNITSIKKRQREVSM